MINSPFNTAEMLNLKKYEPFIKLAEQADLELRQRDNQIAYSWFIHNQDKNNES